jgi:hypothetical protein
VSEKRHRSSGGSRAKQVLAWTGWGMLIALLGTNLVMFLLSDNEGGKGEGFLTIDLLQRVGFWAPMAAAWLFALLGLYWSSKAYKHSERNSLLWARRGYTFTICAALAFVIAFYEADAENHALLNRAWISVVAACVIGGQTVFFALLARAEYGRAETGEGTRHPRRRGERPAAPPAPVLPQTPAGPAESPGAGR